MGELNDDAEVVIDARALTVGGLDLERVRGIRQLFGINPEPSVREVADGDFVKEAVGASQPL